jgi:hypothetical protein
MNVSEVALTLIVMDTYITLMTTSGRIQSEFVYLLFLQAHWETDSFFVVSGVHLVYSTSDQFHYLRVVFSSQIRSKIGSILTKVVVLRITLNLDDTPIVQGLLSSFF